MLHVLHKRHVLLGVSLALVLLEPAHAFLQNRLQRFTRFEVHHLQRLRQSQHFVQVLGAPAAPGERQLVGFDLHAVEFNRTHDGILRQRYPAALPGKAHHHRVDENAVAEQLSGHLVGVKRAHVARLVTHCLQDVFQATVAGVGPGAVFHKRGSWCGQTVDGHTGAPGAHAHHGLFARGDDRVAAQNQIGGGGGYARGADLVLLLRNQHMAPSRAAFLR